jgi:pyruvate/2-oxoglutarate dehydrogenase complex dihydrolipoamide acyltransferase (E2) component
VGLHEAGACRATWVLAGMGLQFRRDHSIQNRGVTFVRNTTLIGALAAPLLIFAMALPCYADSTCKDGTTSTTTGRGACSGHGGVQKAGKAAAAAAPAATESASPAAAPAPSASKAAPAAAPKAAPAAKAAATTGNTDPTGATAKCKDGTYSKSKQHKGSCSHHGGVAEFLTK